MASLQQWREARTHSETMRDQEVEYNEEKEVPRSRKNSNNLEIHLPCDTAEVDHSQEEDWHSTDNL